MAALAAAANGVGRRAKAPLKAAAAAAVVGNAARARPLCMATPRKAAAAFIYGHFMVRKDGVAELRVSKNPGRRNNFPICRIHHEYIIRRVIALLQSIVGCCQTSSSIIRCVEQTQWGRAMFVIVTHFGRYQEVQMVI